MNQPRCPIFQEILFHLRTNCNIYAWTFYNSTHHAMGQIVGEDGKGRAGFRVKKNRVHVLEVAPKTAHHGFGNELNNQCGWPCLCLDFWLPIYNIGPHLAGNLRCYWAAHHTTSTLTIHSEKFQVYTSKPRFLTFFNTMYGLIPAFKVYRKHKIKLLDVDPCEGRKCILEVVFKERRFNGANLSKHKCACS